MTINSLYVQNKALNRLKVKKMSDSQWWEVEEILIEACSRLHALKLKTELEVTIALYKLREMEEA